MEGGAMVAGFSPLKRVIGGFFIWIYFHSARQRRSGHTQNFIVVNYRRSTWMTLVKTTIVL
jgi:hypothetical protein